MKRILILYSLLFQQTLKHKTVNLKLSAENNKISERLMANETIQEEDKLIDFFSEITSATHHLIFRRFSGAGNIPGLLDVQRERGTEVILAHLAEVVANPQLIDGVDAIVAPLEAQSIPELYSIAAEAGKPVFPRTFKSWESKVIRRTALKSICLPFVHIPSMREFEFDNIGSIQQFFEREASHLSNKVFVKEDEGFGGGKATSYCLGPLNKLEHLLKNYEHRSLSLVIEPLLFEGLMPPPKTRVLKIHAFGSVAESEVLVYDVNWKKLEGIWGPDTCISIKESIMDKTPRDIPIKRLNSLIQEFMPYNMISLDYIQHSKSGEWFCIDINHSCGSWGEVQEKGGPIINTIFHKFTDVIEQTDANTQKQLLEKIKETIPVRPEGPIAVKQSGEVEEL